MCVAVGVFTWQALESRSEAGRPSTAAPAHNPKPERYQSLANFEAPPYSNAAFNTTTGGGRFQDAMERYQKHDYAGAIPDLQAAVNAQPDLLAGHFYLGICLLVSGDRVSGIGELRRVIAAGDSPYLEKARFYAAKGLLGEGDAAGCRQLLEQVIEMHSDFEPQAHILLGQVH